MRRQILGFLTIITVMMTTCAVSKPTSPPTASTTKPMATPTSTPTSLTPESVPTFPDPAEETGDVDIYQMGLVESADGDVEALTGATRYDLDVTINESYDTVAGLTTVHYTNREDIALDDIYFRLFPNVSGGTTEVGNVRVDGVAVAPTLEYADSALRVPLPQTLAPDASIDVSLAFTVTVPQEMGDTYGLFGYFDEVLVLDRFYPVIPVYDAAEGWNVEVPPPHGDLTHYDASFYEVDVTAPAALTLVASGIDVARWTMDGTQRVAFVAGPARDFYLAGSERFTLQRTSVGETTVNSYVVEAYAEGAKDALNFAVDALGVYNERFGRYPYTELDVVSLPMLALGIEYPGIIGIRLGLYDSKETIGDTAARVLLESVIAHEVAHQWFYNVVGNDEIDEPWLDEAVVQYATGLYYRDLYGQSAEESYQQSWINRWERIDREDIPIGLPSGAYEPEVYGPIIYGRGPLFVETLAETMGEDTFAAFLRDYVARHRWDIVTTETFRAQAEDHCNCNLTALFETWVEGP